MCWRKRKFHPEPEAEQRCTSCGKMQDESDETWGAVLYDFTQTTGIHGVKQIAEPSPFCFRRLVWAFLLVGGIVLFCIQMIDSIIYYRSYPVTVNLKINYNQTLKFPAITICNQNSFRVTVSAQKGQYSNISSLYLHQDDHLHEDDHVHFSDRFLQQTMDELFLEAAHTKNDLIVSCQWDGENCYPEDFVTSLTDHGVCYTFNSGLDNATLRNVTQTGADRGLRLRLNIEQYEYMQGPNEGAGLKILIHDQGDVALVKDLGQAVPPGSHAFVYINIVKVENLPPKYGVCSGKELAYYERHTMAACLMDCRTDFVESKCKCRDYYMPELYPGYPPVCSVEKYIQCLLPTLDEFNSLKDYCHCPVPCSNMMFNPTITYAANSNFDMEKMLHSDTSHLAQQYRKAREVREKVDVTLLQHDELMSSQLQVAVFLLSNIFEEILNKTAATMDEIESMVENMKSRISFHHNRALDGVHYTVKHDFIRGWEIIEERAFPYLSGSFFETYASIVRFFSLDDTHDDLTKRVTWLIINNSINNRLELANRVRKNLTEINSSFETGKTLLNFRYTLKRRYDKDFVSLEVLQSVDDYDEKDMYFNETMEGVDMIEDSLTTIRTLAGEFLSPAGIDMSDMYKAAKKFVDGCKQYNYRLFQFRDRIVLAPLAEVERRQLAFENLNSTFRAKYEELRTLTIGIRTSIFLFNHSTWTTLANAATLYGKYVSGENISKAELAREFGSRKVQQQLIAAQQYFTSLHSRSNDLKDALNELGQAGGKLYASMLNEPSTKKFYRKLNSELKKVERNEYTRSFLNPYYEDLMDRDVSDVPTKDLYYLMNADLAETNVTTVVDDIDTVVEKLQKMADLSGLIGQSDEQFVKQIDMITQSFQLFVERSQINYDFYRENFMHLDVFFRELSYEEVTQQEAYDLTSLWSDIGGSIGLFVGASALTLFEVVDVFFFTALRMHARPRPRKPPKTGKDQDGNPLQNDTKINNSINNTPL